MTCNRFSLLKDFQRLGISSGDLITVHSSFRKVGPVEGGPRALLAALCGAVGEKGTILMPAFSFSLLQEKAPRWSYENTPSCVGILSEVFRKEFAQYRSIHLSHSYTALGPLGSVLTAGELDSSPCGRKSAIWKFLQYPSKIIMIGTDLTTCTPIHALEEEMGVPYVHFTTIPDAVYERAGVIASLPSVVVKPFQYDFLRLVAPLQEAHAFRYGKVGAADTTILDGRILWETGTHILAANKRFLEVSGPAV